ncbi:DUF1848 family protein [Candidatus Sumerlaeota bacterium]|nr:DUF1848 family protein [Candidatus Sumerlaeota bacterium]
MPLVPPLIVSASRRTDIPAFYGEWFRRRLDAGWCETANPFTGHTYRVSLAPDDVLGWVFWSRNYEPFLDVLRDLHRRGQRFLCHFTIIGYPRILEPRAPDADRMIDVAHRLAADFGLEVVQWRYDPILLSSLTPPEWHEHHFAEMARRLRGAARRCLFSFPTMYKKTARNLEKLAAGSTEEPLRVWSRASGDFSLDDLAALARRLAAVVRDNEMEMHSCCNDRWVDPDRNLFKGHCADWPLLQRLGAGKHISGARKDISGTREDIFGAGEDVSAAGKHVSSAGDPISISGNADRDSDAPPAAPFDVPLRPTRKQCGCYRSVDIGRYHTCAHGCAYCYAVDDPERARAHLAAHDPDSPKL